MTLNSLTPRRREVALLVGRSRTCVSIAADLGINVRTVHSHLQWIAAQLQGDRDLPAYRLVRAWVNSPEASDRTCAAASATDSVRSGRMTRSM